MRAREQQTQNVCVIRFRKEAFEDRDAALKSRLNEDPRIVKITDLQDIFIFSSSHSSEL